MGVTWTSSLYPISLRMSKNSPYSLSYYSIIYCSFLVFSMQTIALQGSSLFWAKVKVGFLMAISCFSKISLILLTYSLAKAPSLSEVTSAMILGSILIFLMKIPLDFLAVLFSNFSTVMSFKCSLSAILCLQLSRHFWTSSSLENQMVPAPLGFPWLLRKMLMDYIFPN